MAYFNASNASQLPRVYCSRTEIVDEHLNALGLSPKFSALISFRNALVQSIAGGNTMVFNQAAKELLEQAGRQQVVSHDWWLYQIAKGAGGVVFYDPNPTLRYRQHENVLMGSNQFIKGKINRMRYVLNGSFKQWNTKHYLALYCVQHLLTQDNQDVLNTFGLLRDAKLKDRIRLLKVCGLYRQTWQGTLFLWIATIFNKI